MSWDAEGWCRRFLRASAAGDGFGELRVEVYEGTVAAVRQRGYEVGGTWVSLDAGELEAMRRGTIWYAETGSLAIPAALRGRYATRVSVLEADCLEAAQELAAAGLSVATLNMASGRNPGGGVHQGAGAQEENVFRRSTLLYSLYQYVSYAGDYDVPTAEIGRYPIGRASGAIYTPGVLVFRSSEATGYAFLRRPRTTAIVSVPAISSPPTTRRDGALWLTDDIAEATRLKIRAILRVAACSGHDGLVLSAFGCGAYRNPPHHVAQLFAEVLAEQELAGVFKAVVFAIFDDHNAHRGHNPQGNLRPFQEVFGANYVGSSAGGAG